MIPTEAPWRNGKTERAGKGWKEDYYRATQDVPDSTDQGQFEEECDAVNFARNDKLRASGFSSFQRVFGKTPAQIEDGVLECGGADLAVWSRQAGQDEAMGRSMELRRRADEATRQLDCERRWKRALAHATKRYPGEYFTGQPVWYWRRGASAAKRPTGDYWHPAVVVSSNLATIWLSARGSILKCARSHVRPFSDEDYASREYVEEEMLDAINQLGRDAEGATKTSLRNKDQSPRKRQGPHGAWSVRGRRTRSR